ncbi:MAG: discoidin domain-containing protein [Calditrichales bacterium]|nr:discoidin domain-containing protein [Calditrichales bacterium]
MAKQGAGMEYQKLSLNGQWQLEPGKEKPEKYNYQVNVPALIDVADPKLDWQNFDYFWYRKEFNLSENDDFENIYLQLEQVKYGTEVWLNDHKIGADIPCYTSQEFDLTPFINKRGKNVLLVRVGAKHTLPEHSAVGNDFEKISWIPGIWGDVRLHLYGNGRVKWTQIIPEIEQGLIKVHSDIENLLADKKKFTIQYNICEKKSGKVVSESKKLKVETSPASVSSIDLEIKISDFQLWSPEHPFLYVLNVKIYDQKNIAHEQAIQFGMRRFEIREGSFYLNGKRRVLFGGNIAFHRMLSDSMRGELPWNPDWIKKVLADIPKENNMFFFRFHLGHAYNLWYDIADEYGIMLQDEWMFWTSTGSAEQIENEFSAWIKENCNHPSIVIWDALNESENEIITNQIIPRLKKLDPTRPWEINDFPEDHPYIYSLGPVLNDKKFGFSRSIFDLQKSAKPTMVNEYVWWWLDAEAKPTHLTEIVKERWLGKNPSKERLLKHQAFLACELSELWRRLDLDAILPFVYLSVDGGATANWFLGSLKELRPKPVIAALKNTFAPLGVSIELWDRHFLAGEKRDIPIYLFNDSQDDQKFNLHVTLSGSHKQKLFENQYDLKTGERKKILASCEFPKFAGKYKIIAKLTDEKGREIAFSEKPLFIFMPVQKPSSSNIPALCIHDPSGELIQFFANHNIKHNTFPENITESQLVFINSGGLDDAYSKSVNALTAFVKDGGILILQEPELGVKDEKEFKILEDLDIHVIYRLDEDRGGYDSYIFPTQVDHALWKNIDADHLKMFNGALGGEIVSQHNIKPIVPFETAASCNLSLRVPAVMEIPYGKGWVIISRIQIRGRILKEKFSKNLYDRRYDPVAERYLFNLLTAYFNQESYHNKIQGKLAEQKIYIARVRASSGQIYDAFDGRMDTRWSSEEKDPQWVWIDLGKPAKLQKITMRWEAAYGKEYEIFVSGDNKNWTSVFKESNSDGGEDVMTFDNLETRYLKIDFIQRGTQWGYSIWEMELE